MKAYKCDMCGKYVDDVFSLNGISKPDFKYYDFVDLILSLISVKTVLET